MGGGEQTVPGSKSARTAGAARAGWLAQLVWPAWLERLAGQPKFNSILKRFLSFALDTICIGGVQKCAGSLGLGARSLGLLAPRTVWEAGGVLGSLGSKMRLTSGPQDGRAYKNENQKWSVVRRTSAVVRLTFFLPP